MDKKKQGYNQSWRIKEEEAALTSYVLKLLGQFSIFFFQGEEASTNF
jgi:hypothetical protein